MNNVPKGVAELKDCSELSMAPKLKSLGALWLRYHVKVANRNN